MFVEGPGLKVELEEVRSPLYTKLTMEQNEDITMEIVDKT